MFDILQIVHFLKYILKSAFKEIIWQFHLKVSKIIAPKLISQPLFPFTKKKKAAEFLFSAKEQSLYLRGWFFFLQNENQGDFNKQCRRAQVSVHRRGGGTTC